MSIGTIARRFVAVLLCLSGPALFLACGGAKTETSASESGSDLGTVTGESSAPSASASTKIDFETCNGYGVEDAARFLELPVAEIEDKSAQQAWGKDCSFVRRGDLTREKAVSFTFNRASSVEEAVLEMEQLAGHASVADEVLPGQRVSHRVEGIGDEAIWVAASDSLYVRIGDATLIVSLPNDEAEQIEVARTVLASSSR